MMRLCPNLTMDNPRDQRLIDSVSSGKFVLSDTPRKRPNLINRILGQLCSFASTHIHGGRYGLQVIRVDASRIAAKVVKFKTIRDRTMRLFVKEDVCGAVPPILVIHQPVRMGSSTCAALPFPAERSITAINLNRGSRNRSAVVPPNVWQMTSLDIPVPAMIFLCDLGSTATAHKHNPEGFGPGSSAGTRGPLLWPWMYRIGTPFIQPL